MKMFLCRLFIILNVFMASPRISFADEKAMAYFPAGEFEMGSDDGTGSDDERPRHKVYLDAFYLDRYETTFKDFEEYLAAKP